MKFLLCFLFLLTISPVNCFVHFNECPLDSNCLLMGGTCVRGECIPRPVEHRRFSDDPQHCDPECPPHLACLWGQCVDGRRKFQGFRGCSRDSQCGTFQLCVFGECVGL